MQYLTFEEYQSYGGQLDEPTFNREELKAQQKIDFITNNRLVNDTVIPEPVKIAIYEVMLLFKEKENYENPESQNVTGFSNDGVSVTFENQSVKEYQESFDKRLNSKVKELLFGVSNEAGISLLYRGWSR